MFNKLKASKLNKYRRIALILSLCVITAWALLGTGTSIAWFKDTTNDLNNIFHFADFDIEVYQRLEDGTWDTDPIDSTTKIFNDEALYEPGYVQVVYLRVDNKGTVPFDFKTAVSVTDYKTAKNVFGQDFNLQDFLLFGVGTYFTENEMDAELENRDAARKIATTDLSNYSTETAELAAGESAYVAIVIHMPETVANEANHIKNEIPEVELGVIITADQITD